MLTVNQVGAIAVAVELETGPQSTARAEGTSLQAEDKANKLPEGKTRPLSFVICPLAGF